MVSKQEKQRPRQQICFGGEEGEISKEGTGGIERE